MGTAVSETLGPPAPVDADRAAVTDRVKYKNKVIYKTKESKELYIPHLI